MCPFNTRRLAFVRALGASEDGILRSSVRHAFFAQPWRSRSSRAFARRPLAGLEGTAPIHESTVTTMRARRASSRDAHARNRSFVYALLASRHSPSSASDSRTSSSSRASDRGVVVARRQTLEFTNVKPRRRVVLAAVGSSSLGSRRRESISTRCEINGNDDDDDDGTGARRGMKRTMTPRARPTRCASTRARASV